VRTLLGRAAACAEFGDGTIGLEFNISGDIAYNAATYALRCNGAPS